LRRRERRDGDEHRGDDEAHARIDPHCLHSRLSLRRCATFNPNAPYIDERRMRVRGRRNTRTEIDASTSAG